MKNIQVKKTTKLILFQATQFQNIIDGLKQNRKQLATHYIAIAAESFQKEFEFTSKAYTSLLQSDLRNQPLTSEEQNFIDEILAVGPKSPNNLQRLLVAMLYYSPQNLPAEWRVRVAFIPTWAASYMDIWLSLENINIQQFTENNQDNSRTSQWKIVDGLEIEGVPPDFELPPIIGENNDYTFIEEKRQAFVDR